MNTRSTFKMLWKMVDQIEEDKQSERANTSTGTIISRFASIIDGRIDNSGHSRSVDSLKLYTTEQLNEELNQR